MIFYIPCNRINSVENEGFNWLNPADFNPHKGAITLYEYSNGWLFEADESFNTYFSLVTGNKLPTITDAEYRQYVLDKTAFLGKERTEQFRSAWEKFQPKINNR